MLLLLLLLLHSYWSTDSVIMYFVSSETSLFNIKIKNYEIELNRRKLKLLYHASTVTTIHL